METADVVIVGGGIMGWCTAYNLLAAGFRGRVVVVERDHLRRHTSTCLALGGFRQQFGTEINIRIARHSVSFYENFAELMETPDGRPDISLRQRGYLFLASEKTWPVFLRRHELQVRLGVEVTLLTPQQAKELVPELDLEGVVGAAFCPRDGYLDPHAVLQGFEAKARHLGAESGHIIRPPAVAQVLKAPASTWEPWGHRPTTRAGPRGGPHPRGRGLIPAATHPTQAASG